MNCFFVCSKQPEELLFRDMVRPWPSSEKAAFSGFHLMSQLSRKLAPARPMVAAAANAARRTALELISIFISPSGFGGVGKCMCVKT